jgi:hypothetical protein
VALPAWTTKPLMLRWKNARKKVTSDDYPHGHAPCSQIHHLWFSG